MNYSSRKLIHRRALIIGLPTLALLFTSTSASSKSGGEGKPQISLKDHYTQNQFLRLVPSEYLAGAASSKTHLIGSFSGGMSNVLFNMADSDRRATQRLMRDMTKLTSRTARLKRLQREIIKTQKLVAALKASIKRLRAKSGISAKLAVKSERLRLYDTEHVVTLVKIWANHPMEGVK